jgi:hypothetical protein
LACVSPAFSASAAAPAAVFSRPVVTNPRTWPYTAVSGV